MFKAFEPNHQEILGNNFKNLLLCSKRPKLQNKTQEVQMRQICVALVDPWISASGWNMAKENRM